MSELIVDSILKKKKDQSGIRGRNQGILKFTETSHKLQEMVGCLIILRRFSMWNLSFWRVKIPMNAVIPLLSVCQRGLTSQGRVSKTPVCLTGEAGDGWGKLLSLMQPLRML